MASNWNSRQQTRPMAGGGMPPRPPQPPQDEGAPQGDVGGDLAGVLSSDAPIASKAQQLMGILRGPMGSQARELLKKLVSSAGEQAGGDDSMLVNAVLRLAEEAKGGQAEPSQPSQPPAPPQAPQPPPMPPKPPTPQPTGPSQPWNR
jgi:hypothetical protein